MKSQLAQRIKNYSVQCKKKKIFSLSKWAVSILYRYNYDKILFSAFPKLKLKLQVKYMSIPFLFIVSKSIFFYEKDSGAGMR